MRALLKVKGNLDRVGRYGGARIYIPSKLTSDSAFTKHYRYGDDLEITLNPETGTIEIKPLKAAGKGDAKQND